MVLAGFPDRAAALLAERFTVYRYDRRGTGGSGTTAPYAVAREVEDLLAVLTAVGGTVALAGWGPGAVLALEAARRLPPLACLAIAGLGPLVPATCPDHSHAEGRAADTHIEAALRRLVSHAEAPIPADLAAARWTWLTVPVRVIGNPALAAVLSEGVRQDGFTT